MSLRDGSAQEVGKGFALFAIAFAVLVFVLSLLSMIGLPGSMTSILFTAVTVAASVGIGFAARTMDLPDFQVASRQVPAALNGMATAAALLGSTGFLGLAGLFYAGNRAALAVVIGWSLGFLALAVLVAPFLRKAAAVSVADFLAIRFGSMTVRLAAFVVTLGCSGAILVAEVAAAGQITAILLPVGPQTAIGIVVVVILACTVLGGMSSVTMTAAALYIVLAIAFLTPVAILSLQEFDVPLPQLSYGYAFAEVAARGGPVAIDPANRFLPLSPMNGFDMVVLALCLGAGVAALPHVVTRSVTVVGVEMARRSTGWGFLFVLIVLATAPSYGAFAQLAQINSATLKPIHSGSVVLELPAIANMLPAIGALVAAGALAAVLAAASALLFTIANSVGHDLYGGVVDRKAPAGRRLIVTRVTLICIAGLSGWYALQATDRLFVLATASASLAAAGLFPALVLGIWWKRATTFGAWAGIVLGFGTAAGYAWAVSYGHMLPWQPLGTDGSSLPPMAAGLIGVPIGFTATILVSLITAAPSQEQVEILESIRHPTPSRRLEP
jgi:cation/acetate symporter